MAGETVLIVDDAPVNLKLTDILLRKEGYLVHTAADAEEALRLLRSFRPDLMLVDIQMPGMDGLELTRRLKCNPVTRDIVVVALTACAMKDDEQKAIEAGCNGYITKPIDTHTLGSRVRQHLESRRDGSPKEEPAPAPAPAPQPKALPDLAFSDSELEGLRRRFLEEGMLQSRQLLDCVNSQFDVAKAAAILHRWVGTAGVLGFAGIAEAARNANELLSAGTLDRARLHKAYAALIAAFTEPREAVPEPLPSFIVEALYGKPLALIGFAPDEGERLCAALERAGARPRSFDLPDLAHPGMVAGCGAVLFHVRPETAGSWWLAPTQSPQSRVPLILVGQRDHILALDRSVQARALEFLVDVWQPEEALMRIGFALARGASPQAAPQHRLVTNRTAGPIQVLIADDDTVIQSRVRRTLEEYGMQCMLASTGTAAMEMIREHRPQAVVLDVNMPGMDGFLVLAAIREENLPVKVVLLTARRHENDLSRAFNLGADDYIMKPFNQIELVARLKRLLRN